MFTSTMTDAEILEEARKDFFELSGKVRMALERFANRHYRMAVNNGLCINDVTRGLIPRTVEQRQWPTRRRNVWRTYFCFDNLPGGVARRVCQYFIYIPLYRETGTEYLFFHGCDKFFVERFTLHFVERYKERHLAPRGIDTGALPIPLYFFLHNPDNFPGTYYRCADIGVRQGQHNKFWIAKEGIFVTDYIDGMLTYITFMDKDTLSPLKAQVYEEEKVWHLARTLISDDSDEETRKRAATAIASMPQFGDIAQRFLNRNLDDPGDGSKQATLRAIKEMWQRLKPNMKAALDESDRRDRELLRRNRTTDRIFLEFLPDELDIKSYHLPPGAKDK